MRTSLRMIPVLCLALACAAAPASAQTAVASKGPSKSWALMEKKLGLQTVYSVDMVVRTMGKDMNSHIARDGDRTRTEMTMPFMNLKMVSLELPRGGKIVSYSLFPDKKKYLLDEVDETAPAAPVGEPELEELGTETYEGVECVKRRAVMVEDGIRNDMVILFSPAQKDMPVKMDVTVQLPASPNRPAMPMTSVIFFKNYDFAAPADSLFEIPGDYAKAASMIEVTMGGAQGFGPILQQMQPPPAAR
jgi:hypothetical protein